MITGMGDRARAMSAQKAANPLWSHSQTQPASWLKQVAVFGRDQRRDVPRRYTSLAGKIGLLYEPKTQTLCTAFCVAPNVIATASHCLFQPRKGDLPHLSELEFRLEFNGRSVSSGIDGRVSGAAKNHIAVGTTRFSKEPPLSAPKDWALARLERPVCQFGTLPVKGQSAKQLLKASRQGRIFQVSYHWDYKRWQLAYSRPCRVSRTFRQIEWRHIRQHFVNSDELVLHDCDTGGASSGSPLLMDTPSGPAVVAVNVGTYTRTRLILREGHIIRRLKPDIIANTAVNARAFAHAIEPLAKTEMILATEEMRELQRELQARSLYTGKIDGIFGRGTRSAIRAYENLTGRPMTGLPARDLLRRLMAEGTASMGGHRNVREWAAKPFP